MELNVINSSTGASVTSWANGLMDPPKSESWRRHKALRCGREYISAGPEIRPRLSILQGKLTVNSPNDALAAKLVGIDARGPRTSSSQGATHGNCSPAPGLRIP